MSNNYGQITVAIVVEVSDNTSVASQKGKVKIRIPQFHQGPDPQKLPPGAVRKWVSDDNLPWVNVIYPLGTKEQNPGSLLQKGDLVYIMYNSTSYRNPLIIGSVGGSVEYPDSSGGVTTE